jgi:CelD/BcsL family acetyltransferase involved in cellulose biosynthesis
MTGSFELYGPDRFAQLRDAWDALAVREASPFLTHAWLSSWAEAFGSGDLVVAVLRGSDGELRAGALFLRTRTGSLRAAANAFSDDWGAVAVDDEARSELWRAVAATAGAEVVLRNLRADHAPDAAAAALAATGRRVHRVVEHASPYMRLAGSFDGVLAGRSSNLRSQVRRRRRALERAGRLELHTTTGGSELDRAFDAFVAIEGSGWKTEAGTALAGDPAARALYRAFAHRAADRGWLRLHLLTLDGRPLAGDFACVIGDQAFMLKTGYDAAHAGLSPGFVLRAEAIRYLIEQDGATGYDLLGGPDAYKLRWTGETRPHVTVRGFDGPRGAALHGWWRAGRPALIRGRDLGRSTARAARERAARSRRGDAPPSAPGPA